MKVRPQLQLSFADAHGAPLRVWVDPDEPDADNFAGGGGARLGIKQAYQDLGIERRAPGIAVNHWPEALAMYTANNPECRVFCEDIVKVDPVAASGGKRIAYAHFSPTCIFFSQAKGGPLDKEATKVRGLAWIAVAWAASAVRPRAMSLENVEPFMKWGPLHRCHSNGCSDELAARHGTVTKRGRPRPKCLKGCNFMRPIKARIGSLFNAFIARLGRYYRHVSYRVLKASDYGAPTSRKRFVLIASDTPAAWPAPTHGPNRSKPWRTAAECIDWSIECPSIFERAKALAEKTLARIRAGIERFVFGAGRPFIVPSSYGDKGGTDVRVSSADEPMRTICGNRDGHGIVSPLVLKAKTYGGGGNDAHGADVPLGTITTPVVVRMAHGDVDASGKRRGIGAHATDQPLGTITAGGHDFAIATPYLVHRSNGERDGGFAGGQRMNAPIGTITTRDHHSASGTHFAATAAYLIRYNGTSGPESLAKPLSTIDTRDRFALVTLTMEREISDRAMRVARFLGYDAPIVLEIDGVQWILVDIGFRMLVARELFLCQGFPPEYRIDLIFRGKPLTKTAQIKCCGNSVPPQLAHAVAIAAIRTIEYRTPAGRQGRSGKAAAVPGLGRP